MVQWSCSGWQLILFYFRRKCCDYFDTDLQVKRWTATSVSHCEVSKMYCYNDMEHYTTNIVGVSHLHLHDIKHGQSWELRMNNFHLQLNFFPIILSQSLGNLWLVHNFYACNITLNGTVTFYFKKIKVCLFWWKIFSWQYL